MRNFKDLSNLQAFFDQMATDKSKVSIHLYFASAIKGLVIHAGEDYVAVQNRRKQRIIPYSAIWLVNMEN